MLCGLGKWAMKDKPPGKIGGILGYMAAGGEHQVGPTRLCRCRTSPVLFAVFFLHMVSFLPIRRHARHPYSLSHTYFFFRYKETRFRRFQCLAHGHRANEFGAAGQPRSA